MKEFSKIANVYLKISNLFYIDGEWDQSEIVINSVKQLIEMFGIDRCMFDTNFPVDSNANFKIDRLLKGFFKIVEGYSFAEK